MQLVHFLGNETRPPASRTIPTPIPSPIPIPIPADIPWLLGPDLEGMLMLGMPGGARGCRVCADGFFALLSGLSFSRSHFMYFYGRLQPLTLLPLGPESGNRKLLLIMLLTLCCLLLPSSQLLLCVCVCVEKARCWLV